MGTYYAVDHHDELYHHGVRGMKWGVRRYQHEDGTRTALGKKHERQFDDGSKSGLRKATITGGLIGRAMYKKKHKRIVDDTPAKESKPKREKSDYDKGLSRATLEGGLVGRALYKKKHAGEAKSSTPAKESKPKREKSDYDKGLSRATLEGGLVGRALYKKKHAGERSSNKSNPREAKRVRIKSSRESREKSFAAKRGMTSADYNSTMNAVDAYYAKKRKKR